MSESSRVSRRSFLKGAAASAASAPFLAGSLGLAIQSPPPADLTTLGISEAARLIGARQLSPVDLVEAILRRIEAVDSRVGAFITVVPEMAREAAREAEREIMRGNYRGPLHGIPFGVKDTHYTKGIRTTASTPVLADFVPDFDATVVTKLNEAGGILIGKTNLPEWSFGGETPGTNNPWDLARSPSGSSGGSAAALAARMLPAATGGDTSASVRGPAAINSVVGMIATYGRVSRRGVVPISWTCDRVGPMTRSVEDNALLLNAMAGFDPNDPSTVDVPVPDFTRALGRGIRGMRLGVPVPAEYDRHHPDVIRAFEAAVKVLEDLGASLREVPMPLGLAVVGSCQRIIRISESAAYHRPFLVAGADRYGEGSLVRRDVEAGSLLTAGQYARALQVRTVFIGQFRALFETIDAYVSPANGSAASVPAPGNTSLAFYQAFNVNGFPAISVPGGFSSDPPGLPIGLQIAAAPWEEETVYQVAHAYESATEWHKRAPAL